MKVRKGTTNDMARVLELIQELAVFEKEPTAVTISEQDLIRDGFGAQPLFETLVAETQIKEQTVIIGMALFYHRYSTWKGKTIHLEDLIVSEKFRNTGAGKALYNEVIKIGHTQKVKRIEWNVLDWNTNAIQFYEKTGAKVFTDWRVAQMNEQAIDNYINAMK